MRWLLYRALMAVALLSAAPVLLIRRGAHYLPTLRGRLGPTGPTGSTGSTGSGGHRGGLWVHAVSVGEVGVAATLARALPADQPAVVTTITPTGQERARAAFGGRSEVAYLPFDLGFAVSRFFRRFDPRALILVEGDYWPLVLREAGRRGLPVAVVNGRVGDRGYRRLRRLHRLWPPALAALFDRVGGFGVQTAEDRRRLISLGVEPERVVVTGNLKYETAEPDRNAALDAAVERLAGGRPILVAGSTMEGEEAAVLDAFSRIGGGEHALLVLAPRHPERWDDAAARVAESGAKLLRRSALDPSATSGAGSGGAGSDGLRPDVLLLDSLGELAGLYRLAAAAFIGGTLVPTGGHNPLEAARWSVPVVVGPSMENFRQIAGEFDRQGAWARVESPEELARVWRGWLDRPEEGREVGRRGERLIEANRGAMASSLRLLSKLGIGN
ncbi:MAG: 3-deoxy-D-manno-octulosonic acid transferase [Acidobacteriota bacterium]|jgi:3-deoxy-D-manno-octulosonic-acid transferase